MLPSEGKSSQQKPIEANRRQEKTTEGKANEKQQRLEGDRMQKPAPEGHGRHRKKWKRRQQKKH
jgi:hypothetical protein